MSINEIQDEIIDEFEAFDDWLERYQLIIDYAKELTKDPMPEEDKNDTNKIDGCQSTVWFTCRMEDGKNLCRRTSEGHRCGSLFYRPNRFA